MSMDAYTARPRPPIKPTPTEAAMDGMTLNKVLSPGTLKGIRIRRGRIEVGKAHAVQDLPPSASAPEDTLPIEYHQREMTEWSSHSMRSIHASRPPGIPDGCPGVVVQSEQPVLNPLSITGRSVASSSSKKPKVKKTKQPHSIKSAIQHIRAPIPTAGYLTYAYVSPSQLSSPQRLLLVLDLNGTLLYRPNASSNYLPRPSLAPFLRYCLSNHSLLIWSSATPPNVSAICGKLFPPNDRRTLLGEWARDTLGLTPEQYGSRVQVYKRLDRIWDDPHLSATHPLAHQGQKWSQENTLLIDDSPMKASAQPYNLVRIPEFVKDDVADLEVGETDVLGQVAGYLEEARSWGNVSAFVRNRKFEVDHGWGWDWELGKKEKKRRKRKKGVQQQTDVRTEGSMDTDTEEKGGVKLEGWMLEKGWA